MPLNPLDFTQPGWSIVDGRWENKDLQTRCAEEQEAARVKAEELEQERALEPRLRRVENSNADLVKAVKLTAEKIGELFKFMNAMDDKNMGRNQRLDRLEASTRGDSGPLLERMIRVESTAASSERVSELMIQMTELKAKVKELETRADAGKRHIANLESKISKREWPSLK